MTEVVSKNPGERIVPFFLRVVTILILVTGIFGLLFYLTITFYQITGRNFLYDFGYKDLDSQGLYFMLILYISLNSGLVLSALQLMRLKKTGMYVFGISYLVFVLLSYFMQDDLGWILPAIGLLLFLTILLHKNKLIF